MIHMLAGYHDRDRRKNFNFINFNYPGMSIEDEEPQLKGKGYPSLAIKAREIELVIDVGEREP